VPRPGRHLECGVPAVRSGVLAFSGVPHFCISVIVLVVAFHGVPWWSILAWAGDLAFCGVPACRAGMPGVLAFQASLVWRPPERLDAHISRVWRSPERPDVHISRVCQN